MHESVIAAYIISDKGNARKADHPISIPTLSETEYLWLHIDAAHPDARVYLEAELPHLDPVILETLLIDNMRPQCSQIGDNVLLFLKGANLNIGDDPEDMISARIWSEKKIILSLRKKPLQAFKDLEQKIVKGNGPKNTGEFLKEISALLFQRLSPVLNDLEERIDEVEDRVLSETTKELRNEIINLRRQTIIFRRHLTPQQTAFEELLECNASWLKSSAKKHLSKSHLQILRAKENLDMLRDREQVISEELSNLLTERLNKNMYILSILSAIFLPLGFLTGLVGVNLSGIPYAESSMAFPLFGAGLVVLVAIQLLFFKIFKWF